MRNFTFLTALLVLIFGSMNGQGCLSYGGSNFVQDNGDGTCTYDVTLIVASDNTALGVATFYAEGSVVHIEEDCICDPESITFPITITCDSPVSISVLYNAPGQIDDCFGRTGLLVLPVEWLGFDINLNDEKIDLTWSTATELNNDYFQVERSSDGRNWNPISNKIPAANNSNVYNNYNYADSRPDLGYNYYRVKQTDFDGRSSTTNTLMYFYEDGTAIDVFPNPVEDVLFIKSSSAVSWNIFTMQGVFINSGSNTDINTSDLNPGSYIIRLNTQAGAKSIRFAKL